MPASRDDTGIGTLLWRINTGTETKWRRVGVEPESKVLARNALVTALQRLQQKP